MTPHTQAPEDLDPSDVLDQLFSILHRDFGCPEDIARESYSHFNPAHAAWQAFRTIESCYHEYEIDEIAESILNGDDNEPPMTPGDNIVRVH